MPEPESAENAGVSGGLMVKRAYVDIPEGQIHYQFEGRGEPLLLLHQGMFSSDEFIKVMPILGRHYQCIARDMLGYGMSDANPPDFTIQDYARADIHFMNALGIKETRIVGVHTGCSIAVEIAIAHPERVDKLVFYGLPSFDTAVRQACIKSYTFSPVEIQEEGSHLISRLWKVAKKIGARATPKDWNRVVTAGVMARGGTFHGEHAVFRYEEEARFPLVTCPTLIISGTEDVFHPRLDMVKNHFSRSKAVVIEEVDGLALLEKPEKFAQVALDFLTHPDI